MKKRIGAVLMGVLLGTSLIGTNVFATETEPPAESETVFEIVEGATGTYVKGSKKDHVIKVRMSTTAEKIHKVTVDNPENELDRDNWSDGDSEEVPPTTDAPVTSEAPAVTSEAPAPSSEAPAPSSEAPAPSSEARRHHRRHQHHHQRHQHHHQRHRRHHRRHQHHHQRHQRHR